MRWTEDQVKACILHADSDVRVLALEYFSDAHSADPDLLPMVIEAVERYGREECCDLIYAGYGLRHNPQTIDWFIRELKLSAADCDDDYHDAIAGSLVQADVDLLASRESDILDSAHLMTAHADELTHRLSLRGCDQQTCWRLLEEFCEANKSQTEMDDINLPHARDIVEALARQPELDRERVLAIVSEEVDDYTDNPMQWLELLAVVLAGEARIEAAVPFLLAKMQSDDPMLSTECSVALIRIGKPEMLLTAAALFPDACDDFKWSCVDLFADTHSELSFRLCCELFEQEADDEVQIQLAYALAGQFDTAGIDAAVKILRKMGIILETVDLMDRLQTVCQAMEYTFPELDEWREEFESNGDFDDDDDEGWDDESAEKFISQFKNVNQRLLELDYLPEPLPLDNIYPPAPRDDYDLLNAPPLHKQKIGRNDPCPCGSGKKFKACCLGK